MRSATTLKPNGYGHVLETDLDYDGAIVRVTEELQKEGFGILSEIDVKGTLKKKLDLDFRRYVILGACNPQYASQALKEEIDIGLLMPCNVIVYERDDALATVALLDPMATFGLTGRTDMATLAESVAAAVRRVAEAML